MIGFRRLPGIQDADERFLRVRNAEVRLRPSRGWSAAPVCPFVEMLLWTASDCSKGPVCQTSEHSARRGPPNSRGTVVHGFPFFESRFRELVFLSEPTIIGFPNSHDRVYRLDSSQVSGFRIPESPGS